MTGTVVIILFLGLCFLLSCSPRFYVLVPVSKTWRDAQNYCRSNYTDLAVVETKEELAELNHLIGKEPNIWIGLFADIEAWRWSLESQDYYGVGEAEFRLWYPGEPNGFGCFKACVAMLGDGTWGDMLCSSSVPFLCYQAGTQNTSASFIYVNQTTPWAKAQSYCRVHYTDLASVRNQTENKQMRMMVQTYYTWIGLYRDSWNWSDGSPFTISNWKETPIDTSGSCVSSVFGQWTNIECSTRLHFACYAVPVWRQVVSVVLEKPDSSVHMEEMSESILQKLSQRLKNQILNGEVNLKWVEPHNGKVFIKKDTDVKEAEACLFT